MDIMEYLGWSWSTWERGVGVPRMEFIIIIRRAREELGVQDRVYDGVPKMKIDYDMIRYQRLI